MLAILGFPLIAPPPPVVVLGPLPADVTVNTYVITARTLAELNNAWPSPVAEATPTYTKACLTDQLSVEATYAVNLPAWDPGRRRDPAVERAFRLVATGLARHEAAHISLDKLMLSLVRQELPTRDCYDGVLLLDDALHLAQSWHADLDYSLDNYDPEQVDATVGRIRLRALEDWTRLLDGDG